MFAFCVVNVNDKYTKPRFTRKCISQFHLENFMSNKITYKNVCTSFSKESKDYKRLLFVL